MVSEREGNLDRHPIVQAVLQITRETFFKDPLHGLKILEQVAQRAWTTAQRSTVLAARASDFTFSPSRESRQEQEDMFDYLASIRMAGGE